MVAETAREHLNNARQLIEIAKPLCGVSTRAAVELRETLAAIDRRIVAALVAMPQGCGHDCHECSDLDACRERCRDAASV